MKPFFLGTCYDLKRLWVDKEPTLSLILINSFKQLDKQIKPLLPKKRLIVEKFESGEELVTFIKDLTKFGTHSLNKIYVFEIKEDINSEQLITIRQLLKAFEAIGIVVVKYKSSLEMRIYEEYDKQPDWFNKVSESADFVLSYNKAEDKYICEKHRAVPTLYGFTFKNL